MNGEILSSNDTLNITVYSQDEALNQIWSRAFEAWISSYKARSTLHALEGYRDHNWRKVGKMLDLQQQERSA